MARGRRGKRGRRGARGPAGGAQVRGAGRAESARGADRRETNRAESAPGGPPPPRHPGSVGWLLEWGKTLVFALVIFLFLRTIIVESFVISSGSMEETLLVGDFLLVNKTVFGAPVPGTPWRTPGYGEPRRGEIIVFRADHAPGLDLVKRVVGLPGDTLSMRDGTLYVNGEPRPEPYVLRDTAVPDTHQPSMDWQRAHLVGGVGGAEYRPTRDNWGPIVVPPERFFMLGDNREHSLDSRFWGLVEERKLKGKPFFVYYSYDRTALEPFRFVTALRLERIGPFSP